MPQIQSIETFSFEIGGYHSKTYKIRALYNIVNYDSFDFIQVEANQSKKYSEEQMNLLIAQFNTIDVLSWKNNYHCDVLDGIQWELKINYNHSKVKKISGSNAYPTVKGQSQEMSEIFLTLLDSLEELIQDPKFFEDLK